MYWQSVASIYRKIYRIFLQCAPLETNYLVLIRNIKVQSRKEICILGDYVYIHVVINIWVMSSEKVSSSMTKIALRWNILLYLMVLLADSEGPDQPARMRRLIRAIIVRICPKTRFRMARPISMNFSCMNFVCCLYGYSYVIFFKNWV